MDQSSNLDMSKQGVCKQNSMYQTIKINKRLIHEPDGSIFEGIISINGLK